MWAVRRYRLVIRELDRFVPLPFRREEDERVELVDAYIELDVGRRNAGDEETDRDGDGRKESATSRIDICQERLFRYPVTGDPGARERPLVVVAALWLGQWARGNRTGPRLNPAPPENSPNEVSGYCRPRDARGTKPVRAAP